MKIVTGNFFFQTNITRVIVTAQYIVDIVVRWHNHQTRHVHDLPLPG